MGQCQELFSRIFSVTARRRSPLHPQGCCCSSCPRNEVNENDKRASIRRSVPDPAPSGCLQSPLPYPRNEIVERGNENESYAAEAAPRWHPGTRASVREPRTRNEVSVNEDPRTRTPVCTVCKHSPRGSDCRSKLHHHNLYVCLSNLFAT